MRLLSLLPLLMACLIMRESDHALDMLFLIAENPSRNLKVICSQVKEKKIVRLDISHRNTHGEFVDICPVPVGVYSRRHFKFDIIVRTRSQDLTIWSIEKKL